MAFFLLISMRIRMEGGKEEERKEVGARKSKGNNRRRKKEEAFLSKSGPLTFVPDHASRRRRRISDYGVDSDGKPVSPPCIWSSSTDRVHTHD